VKVTAKLRGTTLHSLANDKYNRSLHSVIGERPIDVFHASSEQFLHKVSKNIVNAQIKMVKYRNKRKTHRIYRPRDVISVKITNRVENNLTSRYRRAIVCGDLGTKVKGYKTSFSLHYFPSHSFTF
jgi:hypothetical protein